MVDQEDVVVIEFKLISARSAQPPWEFKRTIAFNQNDTLDFVHEVLMYKLIGFIDRHAYAFYFRSGPFESTEGEYGSPRHRVVNLSEYSFRELIFYVKRKYPGRKFREIKPFELQAAVMEFDSKFRRVGDYLPDLKDARAVSLASLDLQIGQTFYYVFDFGDLWIFKGEVVSLPVSEEIKRVRPGMFKLISATGDPFPQYEYKLSSSFSDVAAAVGGEKHKNSDQRYYSAAHGSNDQKIRHSMVKRKKTRKRYVYHVKNGTIAFYRSLTPGSVHVFVEFKLRNRQPKVVVFLVDFYKIGLKDFFVFQNKDIRWVKTYLPGSPIVSIKKEEALELLARGVAIAECIGTPISPKARKWLEYLNVKKVKLQGSLYKCYLCGEGDLTEEQVKKIIEVAKKDFYAGVAGTPQETIVGFFCQRCQKQE